MLHPLYSTLKFQALTYPMYLCKMVTNPKDWFSLDTAHKIVQTDALQKEIGKDILFFVLF